jgi:hypothetical protein
MSLKILGFGRVDIEKGRNDGMILALCFDTSGDARANGPTA